MRRTHSDIPTLHSIAKILGAEGFSDHTANEVKRYWLRRVVTERQKGRLEKTAKAFGEMVNEKLDERDKIVLGKYMSMLLAAQFQTGVRLGLMTLLTDLNSKLHK